MSGVPRAGCSRRTARQDLRFERRRELRKLPRPGIRHGSVEHTTRGWTHAQSVALGMYDTRDLAKRTEKCLSCHLGSQEKFVDHEMIAAGHPDLYFELDSFSAVMPRHWKVPRESAPGVPEQADPMVRRARLGHRTSRAVPRLAGAAAGTRARQNVAGIFRTAMFRLPPLAYRTGAELASGAWLSWAPAGRSAVEYLALRRVPRIGAPGGFRRGGPTGRRRLAQLSKLMSQLNPDREAVAAAAAGAQAHREQFCGSRPGATLRSGVRASVARSHFRRRGRDFRRR